MPLRNSKKGILLGSVDEFQVFPLYKRVAECVRVMHVRSIVELLSPAWNHFYCGLNFALFLSLCQKIGLFRKMSCDLKIG